MTECEHRQWVRENVGLINTRDLNRLLISYRIHDHQTTCPETFETIWFYGEMRDLINAELSERKASQK